MDLLAYADPVEPQPWWTEVEFGAPPDIMHKHVHLRLHFSNLGTGSSAVVEITVASMPEGRLSTTHSFTLVFVSEIGVAASLGLSQNEVMNGMVSAMYVRFGDEGEWSEGDKRLYGHSYDSLLLDIKGDGITYRSKVKADVPHWCDPDVRTNGRFHLEAPGGAIQVGWDEGPTADLDFPFLCEAIPWLLFSPWWQIIKSMYEDGAEQQTALMIQENVDAFAPTEGLIFVDNMTTVIHEVLATLTAIPQAVSINVPYITYPLDDPGTFGIPLNPNEHVVILAHGLVSVAESDTAPPVAFGIAAGPNGLFNWLTEPPVPDPWPVVNGVVLYKKERHEAHKALTGLRREPGKLPLQSANPAALVARRSSDGAKSGVILIGAATELRAGASGTDHIVFAPNDHEATSGYDYGQGSWKVTLVWLPL